MFNLGGHVCKMGTAVPPSDARYREEAGSVRTQQCCSSCSENMREKSNQTLVLHPETRESPRAGLWAIPGGAVSAVWLHNCRLLTWRGEDRAMARGLPFLPLSSLAADRGLGLRRGLAVPTSQFSPGPRAGAGVS